MRNFLTNLFDGERFSRVGRLHRDVSGVAAVEFAMVVPLMVVMFIGTVEFSQAITVDRRVSQVATSTADLIARTKSMTATDMDGVMQVVEQIVKPYDHTLLRMTVINVIAAPDDAANTTVCWAYPHNGGTGTFSKNDPYPLPPGVVEAGDSVIVTDVQYDYTPLIFNHFITTTQQLTEKFFMKPRLSSYVAYDGNAC